MDGSILTGIASSGIALSALLFSIYSFQEQQARAEKHAAASVRPILKIRTQKYLDKKSIKLVNAGIGPAIIKSASFSKDGKSTNKIVDLFDIDIIWESFINVPENTPIRAGEEMVLVLETKNHLVQQGYSENQALDILAKWQQQKTGIVANITYEDIYGNIQEALNSTLK